MLQPAATPFGECCAIRDFADNVTMVLVLRVVSPGLRGDLGRYAGMQYEGLRRAVSGVSRAI